MIIEIIFHTSSTPKRIRNVDAIIRRVVCYVFSCLRGRFRLTHCVMFSQYVMSIVLMWVRLGGITMESDVSEPTEQVVTLSHVIDDKDRVKFFVKKVPDIDHVITIHRGNKDTFPKIVINPRGRYFKENEVSDKDYEVILRHFLMIWLPKFYDEEQVFFDYTLCGGELNVDDVGLEHWMFRHMYDNQSAMASYLYDKGYTSKSGKELTNSHISNFLRKDMGIRQVEEYEKYNYKGCNWLKFRRDS